MTHTDRHSGWNLAGLAATTAVHAALLAVAASAFDVSGMQEGKPSEPLLAVFEHKVPQETWTDTAKPKTSSSESLRHGTALAIKSDPALQSDKSVKPDEAISKAPDSEAPPPAREAKARSISPGGSAVTQPISRENETDDCLAQYASQVHQSILQRRPRGVRREGHAIIAFSLDSAGNLTGAEVSQSSGDAQLDRLALRMVRQAAPFEPPPPQTPAQKLHFTLAVRFH